MALALCGVVAATLTASASCSPDPGFPATALDAGAEASADAATDTSVGTPDVALDARRDVGDFPLAKGDPCRGTPLPLDRHFVPTGMCARLVARVEGSARQIAFAPNGDLFVATYEGDALLLRDDDADGSYSPTEIHRYAMNGTALGNNVEITADHVYAGTQDSVVRWPYAPKALAPAGAREVVVSGLPQLGGHPLHTVHVWDGWLYVHAGSADNMTNPMSPAYDTDRSLLKRFKLADFKPGAPLAWKTGEVVAVGLRNMLGYTRNAAGKMFGVVNGIDDISYRSADVHEDNPGEQIVELGVGRRYGYPFCFTAQHIVVGGSVVPAGTQLLNEGFLSPYDDTWCALNSERPATFVQAHTAPLDILFFDAHPRGALPERWRGGAFVSLHGSVDRSVFTGYKVVWIPFDAAGKTPMPVSTPTGASFPYETVFGGGTSSGPVDGLWTWTAGGVSESPRPVGLAISPVDGALYVSSDLGGFVYRVGVSPK